MRTAAIDDDDDWNTSPMYNGVERQLVAGAGISM
jgi:hypothetical protein